ncbi:hypothetical protein [Rhodococcus sp. 14-2483-1-1]|uniref:hypothetical protein n=1 Tax=Rhodococcus sp. 14-2483-1-1 TaxID=2023148 RepID=UPI00114092D5|nr:hypothetical protein [Rhodococcus sp. 14-2483-1-1]
MVLAWLLGSHSRGRQVTNYFGGLLAAGTAVWSYFAVSGVVSDTASKILMIAWIVQIAARVRLKKSAPQISAQILPKDEKYRLVSKQLDDALSISSTWPRPAVVEFVSMVVNPDTHRGRVVEELKVERTITSKSVRQVVRHSRASTDLSNFARDRNGDVKDQQDLVYLPVLHPEKGHIYDGMTISVKGEDSVESLSYHESQTRYLAAIIVLYREAYELPEEFSDWGKDFVTKFSTLVSKFMTPLSLLQTEKQLDDCKAALEACFSQASIHPGAHASAKFMAGTCIKRYAIVLRVQRQEYYDISYDYVLNTRQLLPSRGSDSKKVSFNRVWRSFLEPSGFIVIPLSRAHRCSSFHLEMSIPSGSYIGSTTVVNEDKSTEQRSSHPAMLGQSPYVRLPTLGLSRAHLYLRSSQLTADSLGHAKEVRFNIYEKPYGSDLLAVLWLVVVVGVSAVAKQALLDDKVVTSNLLAFSIAFPLMLTTAVTVFTARAKNTLNVSVTACGLSLAGAALLVWEVSMLVVGLATKDDDVRMKVRSDEVWTALLAAGLSLALLSVAIFVIRITRFAWFYTLCVYGSGSRIPQDQPADDGEEASASTGEAKQGGGMQDVDR